MRGCGLFNLLRAPHIQLVAQSPWLKNIASKATETQGVNLLFSSRRGHIFVQTDQPIYNPGQRGEPPASGPWLCLSQAAQSLFAALYVRRLHRQGRPGALLSCLAPIASPQPPQSLCPGPRDTPLTHPPIFLLVRYRVFALDQKMRPTTDPLTVTVEVSV